MSNPYFSFFSRNEVEIRKWAIYLGIFVTIAGLAFMAYLGFYNRYWSDDWCYNVDFKNLGIGGTVNTYFMTGDQALRGYAPNRYSLTLLSGLLFSTGIFGAQITATLVIICWIVSLLWVLHNLSKIYSISSRHIVVLCAAILIYYTLYLSPQRFQVLYWMAGIHYSFSIIMGLFLFGLITYQIARDTRSQIAEYFTLPLAFLAGGFSETGCAYLLSTVVLALPVAWYLKQKKNAWAVRVFPTLIISFLGLIGSLVVLSLSPSNTARVEILSNVPTTFLLTLILSFRFALGFIVDSMRSMPLPHIVFALAFLSLAVLVPPTREQRPGLIWKTALAILIVMLVVWLLISAVQAPSAYFYGTPPDPRVKSLARFTMLAGLAVIAWIAGQWINAKWKSSLLIVIALFSITLSMIYTARTTTRLYAELPGFVNRASLWDQRDTEIRNAVQKGIIQLEVVVIDMKGVGTKDIMSSSQMNGEWVSTCASRYYGLEAIKAIAP